MSTYFYLTCEDHDPPLTARDESGQHHYDIPRILEEIRDPRSLIDRLNRGELTWDMAEGYDSYFPYNSAQFLMFHSTCSIGLVDEYGQKYDPTTGEEIGV